MTIQSLFLLGLTGLILRDNRQEARSPQAEEIDYKCHAIFFFFLSKAAGGNKLKVAYIFVSLSIQNQKEASFTILGCHDSTWFHLNLTFLKPWANQCVSLIEMFFLTYVNKLCICLRIFLSSSQFCLRLKSWTSNEQTSLTHGNVLLSYENETLHLLEKLPFFKIHVHCFMARNDSPCA